MLGKYWLSLALVSVVAAGCGDDSSGLDDDAGSTYVDAGARLIDGGADAAADAGRRLTLQSGTYNVSRVTKLSDSCGLTLEDGTFTTLPLANTGTKLSLGNVYGQTALNGVKWTPEGNSLGSGPYTSATMTTLNAVAHETIDDDGCEFDLVRTSLVTITDDNTVLIDYTDNETNQNAKCKAANSESTASCTSHYTFTLTLAP